MQLANVVDASALLFAAGAEGLPEGKGCVLKCVRNVTISAGLVKLYTINIRFIITNCTSIHMSLSTIIPNGPHNTTSCHDGRILEKRGSPNSVQCRSTVPWQLIVQRHCTFLYYVFACQISWLSKIGGDLIW